MKTAARKGQHGRSVADLGKQNVLRLRFSESGDGFRRRGRGRSLHVDGPKTENAREPAGESGTKRVSEAERRVREEGLYWKWKTVTEIRRSSTHDTFIADGSVDLVLNSLADREPVEGLKQRSDAVSFYVFLLFVCFFLVNFVSQCERL